MSENSVSFLSGLATFHVRDLRSCDLLEYVFGESKFPNAYNKFDRMEKIMKKFFFGALTLLCVGFFAVAQDVPVYDGEGADVAILVDIKAHKGVKDNLVLVNLANPNGADFDVYVHGKKGWQKFGNGMLKYLHDKTTMEATSTKDFGKYEYAAIVPLDGKKYGYETRVENSDLYFYVLPEDSSYSAFETNATEIDVSSFQKKLKDNIRLIANSRKIANTGFFIFADNGNGFKLIAAAYLKNKGDTCFAAGFDLNLKKQKYFRYAVCASDGEKYDCTAQAKNSDLYIFIED